MSLTYKETANRIIITLDTKDYYRQIAFKESQFVGHRLRYNKNVYDDKQVLELYLNNGITAAMPFLPQLEERYHLLCEQLNAVLDMNDKKNS